MIKILKVNLYFCDVKWRSMNERQKWASTRNGKANLAVEQENIKDGDCTNHRIRSNVDS